MKIKKILSILLSLAALIVLLGAPAVYGQDGAGEPKAIDAAPDANADDAIQARLENIFKQISTLAAVDVGVEQGVVTLTGNVANGVQAERAVELAERVNGVVTVEDAIEITLDVQGNVAPAMDQLFVDLRQWIRALPLVALALAVFLVFLFAGNWLAARSGLWRRISANPFLADLMAQAVRVVSIVIGLLAGLSIIGATTMIGTLLGGAGVVGLAIGLAVRESLENYFSSIMLSIRQPFRADDHVVIDADEGVVVRLTSRATVLMTLEGNHLRIPNSKVYKATILNYTRNPERSFSFELGVDADDDPLLAIQTGVAAISELEFMLNDPPVSGRIEAVGDSNIVVRFIGWINQSDTDFWKARSISIRAAKYALEKHGFTLPEPIYRVRLDGKNMQITEGSAEADIKLVTEKPLAEGTARQDQAETKSADAVQPEFDVSPEQHLNEFVDQDRALNEDEDLLDNTRPVE